MFNFELLHLLKEYKEKPSNVRTVVVQNFYVHNDQICLMPKYIN